MGPWDSLDSVPMGPDTTLWVQSTIFHCKTAKIIASWDPPEWKLCIPETKLWVKDAGCACKKITGHMTKMAAMPIYGKNPSKIFFSRTGGLISTKLGMKHWWLKHYNGYINHDPVMTLTYFTARSTKVANAFEWGKLLKCHLKWN